MKIIFTLVLSLALGAKCSVAQTAFSGLTIYGELGGSAGMYSINAEHAVIRAGSWTGSARIGYGKARINDGHRFFRGLPVGLNLFYGKGNHHPEVFFGLSYIEGMHYLRMLTYERNRSQALYLASGVGYRFQKPGGGVFARLVYMPLTKVKEFSDYEPWIAKVGGMQHYAGVSIGYSFSGR
jgi:hypothetical protein